MMRALMLSAVLFLLVSCAAGVPRLREEIPPFVDPPESEASSLLAVELIPFTEGQRGTAASRTMINLPESGFYPVVIGPGGKEVDFSIHELSPFAGMIFYKENLSPGAYILTGFRYFWMSPEDRDALPWEERTFDGRIIHEDQNTKLLKLRRPSVLYLKPGSVMSLGRYSLSYTLQDDQENPFALDRWRYRRVEPFHNHVLQVIRGWYSGSWPAWNARNPERVLK